MQKKYKIIVSILVVTVLLLVYAVFDKKSKEKVVQTSQTVATTTTNGAIHVSTGDGGGYTIEEVPINHAKIIPQPIPDLNRPVHPIGSVDVSPEAITRATAEIFPIQARLKKEPNDLFSWISLGIYQKMAGDYEGAAISWQYANKLVPTDYISLGNLGALYGYFIHNNVKAEMYYKQAIAQGPKEVNLYIQFAEFYREVLKDKEKAKVIVEQGLSKIPNDANLLQMKASFLKN